MSDYTDPTIKAIGQVAEAINFRRSGSFVSPGGTELIAPKGKFRAIGVDTFEGPFADWVIGDYFTKEEALAQAEATCSGRQMTRAYVYDDAGKSVSNGFGSY